MSTAFIGLGSNLGDRAAQIVFALEMLEKNPCITQVRSSSFYETTPVGPVTQDDFLNAVAEIETTLEPIQLLTCLLEIERAAGRTRDIRWGPRTLDLDLLAYDQVELQSKQLTLPHPEAAGRSFVLTPWAELAPDWRLSNRSIAEWLAELDSRGVHRMPQ